MSVIEEAIVKHVTDDLWIAGLIAGRMRPEMPDEYDAYPCLVYSKENDDPPLAMGGAVNLIKASFHFEAWAQTYKVAKQFRANLNERLHGIKVESLGVFIRVMTLVEGSDLLEQQIGRDRKRIYGCALTLNVTYKAAS